ncbi:MAG: IPT/TIG domain-containing protein, partial [Rubrivivax sp.]|nr:IPT/TIG domain-containing protein [Rubrivivax sp.]
MTSKHDRTEPAARRRALLASALATAALLAACGGSGGDSEGAAPPPPAPPPPPPASGSVQVTASLGAVFNADVTVSCAPTGAVLGTAATGSTGAVNVATTGSCAGPVLVSVAGRADGSSTYFDEALGAAAPLPAGTRLRALAPSLANPMTVGVTALTEVAAAQALATAGSLAAVTAVQANAANAAIVTQVLGAGVTLDILGAPTLWGAATAAGSLGTSAADRYAYYLGALAKMGQGSGASPALAVASALANDLADGTMNGSSGGFTYSGANFAGQLNAALAAMASFASPALQTALNIVPVPPVALSGFTPASGTVGAQVTLSGSGFDADGTRMVVKFSNDVTATVVTSSTSQLVVQVPAGAVNGPITVTNNATGRNATTATSFTVTPVVTLPAVPAGLGATPVSATQITLNWAAAVGAESYNIYRSTGAGVATSAGNKVNTGPVLLPTFADSGLVGSTTYFYKVTAFNAAGESVGSTEASATTLATGALAWRNATASRLAVVYDRTLYLNGKFTTLHFPGVVSTSTDGASWTTAQTGTTDSVKDMVYGNGRYLALATVSAGGGNVSYVLRTSADGQAWTTPTLPAAAATLRLAAILFANGKFTAIAAGQGGAFGAEVLSSTDGLAWTSQTASTFWNDVGQLAYGNGVYVATGGVVQVSTDGVTWTMPITSQTPPNRLKYLNGQFFMVGNNGLIRTSANGSTWTTRTSGTTRNLNDIDFGNGTYAIAGAFNAQTVTGTLLTSTDAATWTLADLTAVA